MTYRAEIERWREERLAALTADDGWLTLVGLYWLDEGENPFGSASQNKVVLPASAPTESGVFIRAGDQVTVRPAADSGVTCDGQPVSELALKSDADGDPTVIELGSVMMFVINRGDRLGVRLKDRENPARKGFHGIDSWEIDEAWRFTARLVPHEPPRELALANVLGGVEEVPSPGALTFEIEGTTHRLDAIRYPGSDQLFVVFADETTGKESYGGGRFLYSSLPDEKGEVVVDFNQAYNPPCVFTPYATCPLPPAQNRLPLRVTAGEKSYAH